MPRGDRTSLTTGGIAVRATAGLTVVVDEALVVTPGFVPPRFVADRAWPTLTARRITVASKPGSVSGRVDGPAGHGRRVAPRCELGFCRLARDSGPQRRLSGASGRSGAAERRLSERPAHRAHGATRRRRSGLQLGQLTAEVGHGGVRSVLDPRAEHRGDENGQPSGGDDQKNELSHEFCVCRKLWSGRATPSSQL